MQSAAQLTATMVLSKKIVCAIDALFGPLFICITTTLNRRIDSVDADVLSKVDLVLSNCASTVLS